MHRKTLNGYSQDELKPIDMASGQAVEDLAVASLPYLAREDPLSSAFLTLVRFGTARVVNI